MALSPKERERIIEEETLRFDTRRNLHKKACAERPVRWPWVLLGLALIFGLWCHIFCGGASCSSGQNFGKRCPYESQSWAPDDGVAPGQPLKPEKK